MHFIPASQDREHADPLRLTLRPQEAAAALGVSLRTLMMMKAKGEVPFVLGPASQ
jgi:hypothetical protein